MYIFLPAEGKICPGGQSLCEPTIAQGITSAPTALARWKGPIKYIS